MKTVCRLGAALAILFAGIPVVKTVAAEEIKVGAYADINLLSAYVWRGQVLNNEAVLQPSATITKGGFAINLWGNYNYTDRATGKSREYSEIDLTVSYSRAFGPVTLGAGCIEYLFPNQTLVDANGVGTGYPGTREVYLSASLPGLPVVPSLTVYYDYGEADSLYASGSLAYTAKFNDALCMNLNASLGYGAEGYNSFYFGINEAALNDGNIGVSMTWTVCPNLSLTPAYQYTMLVDQDIESAAAVLYKDRDQSVFSVKATFTF